LCPDFSNFPIENIRQSYVFCVKQPVVSTESLRRPTFRKKLDKFRLLLALTTIQQGAIHTLMYRGDHVTAGASLIGWARESASLIG
jgi:hypothetical protein